MEQDDVYLLAASFRSLRSMTSWNPKMIISGCLAEPMHSSRNFVFSGGPVKSLGLQLSMFQEHMRTLTWLWLEYSASRSSSRVSRRQDECRLGLTQRGQG